MSKNYSTIEKNIAKFLSGSPKVKKLIKNTYQRLSFLLHKKNEKLILKSGYKVRKVGDSGNTFFGYYDKSPISPCGKYIAFIETESDTSKKPSHANSIVRVVVKDLAEMTTVFQDEISAFNWQQGNRLHWIDSEQIVYNIYDGNTDDYHCIKVNIYTKQSMKYELPLADSYNYDFFINLDYKKLANLRPDYGYFSHLQPCDEKTKIYKIDFISGVRKLLFSLDQLDSEVSLEKQKINHVMISPDGSKFIFMHRFYDKNDSRVDNLYSYDLAEDKLKKLNTGKMVSHLCWISNNELFGYLSNEKNEFGFFTVDVFSNSLTKIKELDEFGDGHPSYMNGKVLIDSYPNKSRMQLLYLFDLKTKKVEDVAEFFHGFKFAGETRCDLHPRYISDKNYAVDSVYQNTRGLYLVSHD